MIVAGVVGLIAATVLTYDKLQLLQQKLDVANGDADEVAGFLCDVSRWASCSGVMSSEEASAFGIPNSMLGMIGFSVLLALGVVHVSGISLPRWMWAGVQVGVTAGVLFVTWLQYQAIYDIGLLCLYCVAVWIVVIPIFVLVTRASLNLWRPGSRVARFLSNWTLLVVLLWYVIVTGLIFIEFGSSVFS
ncbi:hypothetical protein AFL01nite_10920 [Aeromicrobium flavum]|uniref:Vitamin K epoxide reductase domain-containing protein n=2 Tax=Aeromicrobium flavum TaxID=416568 RepID=A0A512HTN2_9ACTN|nr:hypothetical protein AFL01nite_10920 [Aeromicrobium flavum]